jgi:DUF4097 and DUF4098 domain-containing protein YvlB
MRLRTLRSCTLALTAILFITAGAAAEFRLEKDLQLDPGGTLELDTDVGSLTVRGTPASGARIVVTSKYDDVDDRLDFDFREESGRVVIEVDKRGSFSRWFGSKDSLHFDIEVPRQTDLEVDTSGGRIDVRDIDGDVTAHTSGGRLSMQDIEGTLDGHTSGGAIKAKGLVGDAKLSTSGGSVSVEGITGDLLAKTSGGWIEIEGAQGEVVASTSGGSVTVRFAQGNSNGGSLSTSGGRITAYVDPAASLDIDASTSGGRVTVDLPITVQGTLSKRSINGKLNGGGTTLRLHSSGGGVSIKSL